MPRSFHSYAVATALLGVSILSPVIAPRVQAEEPTAAQRVEVGQTAPDFTLPDPDGSNHSTAGLRGEKNLLLVFFRGAW